MDLCDEVSTNGDKKHANVKSKASLKHKYYWVNKEENKLFNSTMAVHHILNNQDKVTVLKVYNIIFDTDLGKYFCAMRLIPCTCTRVFNNSSILFYLTWINPTTTLCYQTQNM